MYTEANETTLNGIAKVFLTSRNYSRLIKKGQPNVYLLNAEETSVSEDFRCFDIGRSEGTPSSFGMRNHKVIILMGATGCGKSTLINGMVNYILGVKWNDPFRFKCVRETTARNQAHSQTSRVTAYTLRHHDGMAVPYSITIIDTPGYGHITENKKDKKTTRKIHEFLTQQETRVDEIHAVCFVAASGDNRLTTTQCYIDSVLSIFGKDVKENIRLLVTFADNAHPPVVEACLAANFPVTFASAGITFSKFNCSVLYANNDQQGEDGPCFDELFWDMGQENFHKFFTMLDGMNGKDLKSTRNVIQSRGLLEQSLKNIEQELEVCFAKIETMEILQRKMREYGVKMESETNFTFEKTEIRPTKFLCGKGFFAYNVVVAVTLAKSQ
jgi:GTP-binding protein EngB required for normal cell division